MIKKISSDYFNNRNECLKDINDEITKLGIESYQIINIEESELEIKETDGSITDEICLTLYYFE